MSKLTAMQIKSLVTQSPKKHADGGGLYFCVRQSGSPYWMLRYSNQGKRREVTLGQHPEMSLSQAREEAVMAKKGLRSGSDPIQEKAKLALPELNTVSELFQAGTTATSRSA